MGDVRKPYRREMPKDHMGGGVVTFMTAADGWVMVRRPDCMPFVVPVSDWNGWKEVS